MIPKIQMCCFKTKKNPKRQCKTKKNNQKTVQNQKRLLQNQRQDLQPEPDSFFLGSHLEMGQIVFMLYLHVWCTERHTIKEIKQHVGINTDKTVVDWHNFFRDECAEHFVMHPQVLGGPGHAVEVDEAKFGRRKYNRGRYIESHWVLGGIDRDRKQVFMVVVDRGDAATLIPIIQQYVRPGTLITDEWRAYRTLHLLSGTSIKLSTTVNTLLIPIQGHIQTTSRGAGFGQG